MPIISGTKSAFDVYRRKIPLSYTTVGVLLTLLWLALALGYWTILVLEYNAGAKGGTSLETTHEGTGTLMFHCECNLYCPIIVQTSQTPSVVYNVSTGTTATLSVPVGASSITYTSAPCSQLGYLLDSRGDLRLINLIEQAQNFNESTATLVHAVNEVTSEDYWTLSAEGIGATASPVSTHDVLLTATAFVERRTRGVTIFQLISSGGGITMALRGLTGLLLGPFLALVSYCRPSNQRAVDDNDNAETSEETTAVHWWHKFDLYRGAVELFPTWSGVVLCLVWLGLSGANWYLLVNGRVSGTDIAVASSFDSARATFYTMECHCVANCTFTIGGNPINPSTFITLDHSAPQLNSVTTGDSIISLTLGPLVDGTCTDQSPRVTFTSLVSNRLQLAYQDPNLISPGNITSKTLSVEHITYVNTSSEFLIDIAPSLRSFPFTTTLFRSTLLVSVQRYSLTVFQLLGAGAGMTVALMGLVGFLFPLVHWMEGRVCAGEHNGKDKEFDGVSMATDIALQDVKTSHDVLQTEDEENS